MASQSNIFAPLVNLLKVFNPITYWEHILSPTFNFGCNIQDMETEHHVVDKVGSYGKQVNCVLDVLTVLVADDRLDPQKLTPQELNFVNQFKDLAREADRVAAAFQDKPPHHLTGFELDHVLEDLCSLKRANPSLYQEFKRKINTSLADQRQLGRG